MYRYNCIFYYLPSRKNCEWVANFRESIANWQDSQKFFFLIEGGVGGVPLPGKIVKTTKGPVGRFPEE